MKGGLLALLGLAAGCSSFEKEWKAAREPTPSEPFLGRWEGEWRSEATGHSGKLRAIVAPRPEGGYQARYRARWGCCFRFQYTVPMTVEEIGGAHRFQGSADLGWLAGGVFEYQARAGAGEFESTYRSKSDRGTFRMTRPRG